MHRLPVVAVLTIVVASLTAMVSAQWPLNSDDLSAAAKNPVRINKRSVDARPTIGLPPPMAYEDTLRNSERTRRSADAQPPVGPPVGLPPPMAFDETLRHSERTRRSADAQPPVGPPVAFAETLRDSNRIRRSAGPPFANQPPFEGPPFASQPSFEGPLTSV